MARPKVLITNKTLPERTLDLLRKECDLIIVDESKENIIENVKGVDAIYWATMTPLDNDILDAAGTQLKTVAIVSAGYNHINIAELKKRNITLSNCPNVSEDAVADMAVLLALAASRRLHEGRLKIENNEWFPCVNVEWMIGQDILESTVGIIGLGGIGQELAKRLQPFKISKILYTGHREKPEGKELGGHFVSLDTLARESDFVFVTCPLTDETKGMCNSDFFSKMKNTAVFINVSRGPIVVQEALITALKEGQIFAAGLDVMTPEPLPGDHELLKLPNVVAAPHIGTKTPKTRNAILELAARNILQCLRGEELLTPVIF